jgi:hypothetical protein
MSNITINLTVPDKSVVSAVYDAVKNPDCVRELKYADPQEIPAILFKYTRGCQQLTISLIKNDNSPCFLINDNHIDKHNNLKESNIVRYKHN